MSKNVSIKEGQTAKTFSDVAKLKTNLVGSGTALWVPEEEVQLTEKTIDHTGEYEASTDNAYGYSKVTVDIDLPEKTLTANGTYSASSDDVEGWSEVTVDVQQGQKIITENGTYNAADDEVAGWDTVEVDVPLGTTILTENGTYSATDDGVAGWESVEVDVQMSQKLITQNGTYNAEDDDVTGWDTVEVDIPLGTKDITENGTYNAEDDDEEGWSTVNVDILLSTLYVTENGTYTANEQDVSGWDVVEVDIPQNVGTLNVTENGTYHASTDNLSGYDEVNVNVTTITGIDANGNPYTIETGVNLDGFPEVNIEGMDSDGNEYSIDSTTDSTGNPTISKDEEPMVPETQQSIEGKDTSGNDYSVDYDDEGLPTFEMENPETGELNEYSMDIETDPTTGEPSVTLSKLPKSIVITAGSTTYNNGDSFDSSRYTIKANWDTAGSTQSDITASCVFYPADGTILQYGTDYTMTVEWTYKGRTYRTSVGLTVQEGSGTTLTWSLKTDGYEYRNGIDTADFSCSKYWFVCTYGSYMFVGMVFKNNTNEQQTVYQSYERKTGAGGSWSSFSTTYLISANTARTGFYSGYVVDYSHSPVDGSVVENATSYDNALQKYTAFVNSLNS